MTIEQIFKRAKWALGKETPQEIYIGTNFNPSVSFVAKDKDKKGLLTTIDSIPIYVDSDLKGQKVKVKGKKKEVIIDLATVKKYKLIKVK